MTQLCAIVSLVNKGMIQPGTVVGISSPQSAKVYHRFLIASITGTQVSATHMASNKKVNLAIEDIVEIDGMSVNRYLSQADLDDKGDIINKGKKRGRRPKHNR